MSLWFGFYIQIYFLSEYWRHYSNVFHHIMLLKCNVILIPFQLTFFPFYFVFFTFTVLLNVKHIPWYSYYAIFKFILFIPWIFIIQGFRITLALGCVFYFSCTFSSASPPNTHTLPILFTVGLPLYVFKTFYYINYIFLN